MFFIATFNVFIAYIYYSAYLKKNVGHIIAHNSVVLVL